MLQLVSNGASRTKLLLPWQAATQRHQRNTHNPKVSVSESHGFHLIREQRSLSVGGTHAHHTSSAKEVGEAEPIHGGRGTSAPGGLGKGDIRTGESYTPLLRSRVNSEHDLNHASPQPNRSTAGLSPAFYSSRGQWRGWKDSLAKGTMATNCLSNPL